MKKAFSEAKITELGTTVLVTELSCGSASIMSHTPRLESGIIDTSVIMLRGESIVALKEILKHWKGVV